MISSDLRGNLRIPSQIHLLTNLFLTFDLVYSPIDSFIISNALPIYGPRIFIHLTWDNVKFNKLYIQLFPRYQRLLQYWYNYYNDGHILHLIHKSDIQSHFEVISLFNNFESLTDFCCRDFPLVLLMTPIGQLLTPQSVKVWITDIVLEF